MQEFTLIVPYYRNPQMLRRQIEEWELYPRNVRIILVDDGSPVDPSFPIVRELASVGLRRQVTHFTITVDIPWNRGGARNLGAMKAQTEWIVHVDIDHLLPAPAAMALLRLDPSPKTWYRFERWRRGRADETRKKDAIANDVEWGQIHPHMDSYLVTRRMYWQAGGYDEDYSGCLGGGSPFTKALAKLAEPKVLAGETHLVVYTRDVVDDASDLTLSRDRDEYARRQAAKKKAGATAAQNPIRFPYVQEELMYPKVAGEVETLRKVRKGFSIARYGDGELKVLDGKGYTRERQPVPKLTAELRAIASNPHEKCLIGIPTMDPKGTKYDNWIRHEGRFLKYFNEDTGLKYYSSLITRPDCGKWMETHEYYQEVIAIWANKHRITVVSEPDSKLLAHVRLSHPKSVHVECPMYEAYAHIDRMEREVIESQPEIALLSVGVTATCLAHRLCAAGIHAVDLGSIGGFLLRWRNGKPKPGDRNQYAKERSNETDTDA